MEFGNLADSHKALATPTDAGSYCLEFTKKCQLAYSGKGASCGCLNCRAGATIYPSFRLVGNLVEEAIELSHPVPQFFKCCSSESFNFLCVNFLKFDLVIERVHVENGTNTVIDPLP
jgi:hypothetical protein